MNAEVYTAEFFELLRERSTPSAQVVVPLVLELIPARSVVDIGCGEGAWLAAFRRFGVEDVLGLDGDYVNESSLLISRECFRAADLSRPFALERTFDLAVSLEVAEHLPPDSAPGFVDSIASLAPVVLFSAAIPHQGGVHHVNEQWPEYWIRLFDQHNFAPVDPIRRRIWQNETVQWWFVQNTLLFVERSFLERSARLQEELRQTDPDQLALVHPRRYEALWDDYQRALSREAFLREHPATGVRHAVRILWDCARISARQRLGALWKNRNLQATRAK